MADIVMLPIENLLPHPLNPRKDLGDLTELADSIRTQGVLQNLTVVPEPLEGQDKYRILIGHRRHAAAKLAGLTELPCSVVWMDKKEQVQTMLIENMQRSDLTVYEQAQGFQMMLDLGSTVEEIAEKSGFSASTVRRRVKWMELDQKKFKQVTDERQISITDLDSLSQIEDIAARNECLDKIGTRDFDMAIQKAVKRQNIDVNMPKVKEWLKSVKAKKINDNDRWNGKYDSVGSTIYIDKWEEDGNKPKDDITKEPVFYWLGKDSYDYGQLRLFHEHKKAPPVKRPQEEIDKEKAVRAAWDRLESLGKTTFELRKKFIDGFTVTKKNEPQVIFGAVIAGCYNAIGYNSSDRGALYTLAGITDTGYIPEREEKFFEGFDKVSGDDWVKLVYALFGDADINCSSGYRREFPKFDHNRKLELIYRWLSTLGYKMSTEEAQMLSGDHEVYKAGEDNGEV
ncbi:MAG: ParB/RepB/Spo0J family partition protein [Oscillospiraceae bacterium]|nr:ParB/RepB/Spo0J family partition protein [Oscillospiraceae bacterium]